MEIQAEIPFEKLNVLSKISKDFISAGPNFSFGNNFSEEKILAELDAMNFSLNHREVLVEALQEQYASVNLNVPNAVELLKDSKTYTITTGHQLCLFTGPLYMVYKIATVIKMSSNLKRTYPDYNFVPVFWMASEDHDFEEASKVNVQNKPIIWKDDPQGAVGRMSIEKLKDSANELAAVVGINGEEFVSLVNDSLDAKDVAASYHKLIHSLFGDKIVILDADYKSLKALFIETAINDLKGDTIKKLLKTNEKLTENGYSPQVNGREINLFWLKDGSRERIVKKGEGFQVLGSDKVYSLQEMTRLFRAEPESVSPNVILRPVYQQIILPNLVYVGGGGEIAYWLQLKDVFNSLGVHYPMLQVRASFIIMREKWLLKWTELGFSFEDLFRPKEDLMKEFVVNNQGVPFEKERQKFDLLVGELKQEALKVDKNMAQGIDADITKMYKGMDKLEKRISKTMKNANKATNERIERILGMVYPNGNLQERYSSIFDMFSSPDEVASIIEFADPTNNSMKIMKY
ncbi:MAG: bacillithiol biosynthesis cysteine-adding enzyme BshC [Parvicellaceae bacterium]|jgi:bacillithiol biosynthesis cysteine-adding enzyme BshC